MLRSPFTSELCATPAQATRLEFSARPLSVGAASDRAELFDDDLDRLGCVDCVGAGGAQQRFNVSKVLEDEIALAAGFPVIVGRPRRDAPEEHVARSRQKDNSVES